MTMMKMMIGLVLSLISAPAFAWPWERLCDEDAYRRATLDALISTGMGIPDVEGCGWLIPCDETTVAKARQRASAAARPPGPVTQTRRQ